MTKVKMFYEDYHCTLEAEINNFIKDKRVISVSYSAIVIGYRSKHCACVTYEE